MQDLTFQQFSDLIHKKSGIFLAPEKKSLLVGRIRARMQSLNLQSFESYLSILRNDPSGNETIHLINSIATHHTFFFREKAGLQAAIDEIARRIQQGQYRLRIWCAASSSGEEPYSLAMMLFERFGERMSCFDIKILATDISSKILNVASKGRYNSNRIGTLPGDLKERYFEPVPHTPDEWQMTSRVKDLVSFRYLNLCSPRFPFQGPFDVILCRNVMIYFDTATIHDLIGRFEKVLNNDGLCIIGATETIREMTRELRFEQPAVFRKPSKSTAHPSPSSNKTQNLTDKELTQCR